MIIEYALLVGAAGANVARMVNAAVINKQKSDLKDSTEKINTLREQTTKSLVQLGTIKAECCINVICPFLETYISLLENPKKKCVTQDAEKLLDLKKAKEMHDGVNSFCKEIGNWKPKDLEYEKIVLATGFGKNMRAAFAGGLFIPAAIAVPIMPAIVHVVARKILPGNTFPNPTIAWIAHPLFSNKINVHDNHLICNGNIDESVLAMTNYPHSMVSEKNLRKLLKDDEKKKELGDKIENAGIFVESIYTKIVEISKCLEAEREKLSLIIKKLKQIQDIQNETDYANSLSKDIIYDGLYYLMDILTFVGTPIFEYNGDISEQINAYLEDETFQKRVVADLNYSAFDKYYQDFVDIFTANEPELSKYNIKIIYSQLFGNEAKFYYYYNDNPEKKWVACSTESALCYDEKYTKFTEESIHSLLTKLHEDMSLGAIETTIYYLGNKDLYDILCEAVNAKYKNIKTMYMGEEKNEK